MHLGVLFLFYQCIRIIHHSEIYCYIVICSAFFLIDLHWNTAKYVDLSQWICPVKQIQGSGRYFSSPFTFPKAAFGNCSSTVPAIEMIAMSTVFIICLTPVKHFRCIFLPDSHKLRCNTLLLSHFTGKEMQLPKKFCNVPKVQVVLNGIVVSICFCPEMIMKVFCLF